MPAAANRDEVPPPAPPAPARERLLTGPLVAFLVIVAGILLYSAYERWSVPSLDTAVRALADGDVDGPERPRILQAVVDGAALSQNPHDSWWGMMAAVALADREAYERARARLGPGPAPAVLGAGVDPTLLHLGDPLLANLAAALSAEAGRDAAEARRLWQQVKAQSRLAPRPLASELADEALARLPR